MIVAIPFEILKTGIELLDLAFFIRDFFAFDGLDLFFLLGRNLFANFFGHIVTLLMISVTRTLLFVSRMTHFLINPIDFGFISVFALFLVN